MKHFRRGQRGFRKFSDFKQKIGFVSDSSDPDRDSSWSPDQGGHLLQEKKRIIFFQNQDKQVCTDYWIVHNTINRSYQYAKFIKYITAT